MYGHAVNRSPNALRLWAVAAAAALTLTLGNWFAPLAQAAGGVVSTCDQAHLAAAVAVGGTITFSCNGTIVLSATVSVTRSTVLDGSGQTVVIDGGGRVGLFEIPESAGSNIAFGVVHLTLQNGHSGCGGAIAAADGPVTISDSTFRNNHADCGGAVSTFGNTDSSITVVGSTFVGNGTLTGGDGGALDSPNVSVANSTFVNNTGGLGGAIVATEALTAVNSTFVANTGNGTIELDQGTATLKNTILSGGGPNCYIGYLGGGTLSDQGGNLSDDASCAFTQSSSRAGVSTAQLALAPLANNGGPTPTVALLPNSLAIDAGVGCPPPSTDQRGSPRPTGTACDSGAYEAPSRKVVVVFLAGLTSHLAQGALLSDFWRSGGLVEHFTADHLDASFEDFSYSGAATPQFGNAYSACDTLRHLSDSEAILDKELKAYAANHPGIDVYLVGHSQGGVLALGYLAWLAKSGRSLSAPSPGMHLAGIVTLDSPIGGLSLPTFSAGGATVDLEAAAQAYILSQCHSAGLLAPDLADLLSLGAQGGLRRGWPWGKTGSISNLYGVSSPADNQTLAGNAGVRVLTIGNTRDLLMASSGLESTQWLADAGSSGVFSRAVNIPANCSTTDFGCWITFNHGAVLADPSVQDAVLAFIRGGTPSLAVPQSPFDIAASAVWDTTGGVLTAANGLVRLAAEAGSVASPGQASLASVSMATIPDLLAAGQSSAGPAVSVTLPALAPGASATLTLPLNVSALTTSSTAAIFRDGAWTRLPTTLDLATGSVTAAITEGGVYAPLTVPLAKVALSDAIGTGILRGGMGFTTRAIAVSAGGWVTYRVATRPSLAGRTLTVWSRVGTAGWRKVATRKVAADGTIHYYTQIRVRTTFRATWQGDGTYAPATSHGRTVSTG